MTVDIATLGLKVDATDVDTAKAKLDQLAATGDKTEGSARRVTKATDALNAELSRTAPAATSTVAGLNNVQAAAQRTNSAIATANKTIATTASASRLSANEALNLSRQFADIGVTAAMGMNPLMILIQQGPQIADIMRTSGLGVRGLTMEMLSFFKIIERVPDATGNVVTKLGALARIGGPIAIGIGAVTGAFAIFNREVSDGAGDIANSMGLTKKQLEELKDEGVSTTVTLGDSFTAFFQTIGQLFSEAFKDEISIVKSAFEDIYEFIRDGTVRVIHDVIEFFVGGYRVIVAAWDILPQAFMSIATRAANGFISIIEAMINRAVDGVNALIERANQGAAIVGIAARIPTAGRAALGRVEETAMPETSGIGRAWDSADATATGFMNDFGSRMRRNAINNRRSAIKDALGDDPEKKAPKPKKTDAERELERRTKEAEAFIEAMKEETSEIGKNRIETKMLAAERAAAVAPTEALKDEIKATAEAWKAATLSEATRQFKQELGDQAEALEFENSLIGMNARELAVANAQREISLRLRQLERDGISISADEIARETQAILDNANARGQRKLDVENAQLFADKMRDVADSVREATDSFRGMFGTAGEGFANLVTTIYDHNARLAELTREQIELQEEYNNGAIDGASYEYERSRNAEQMALAQQGYYGNMLGAAKTFFREGSTGWRVLEAAERAYRLFQFAMQIRAMVMDSTSTAASVANSGVRAAADGAAAIAKTFASVPFPFNIAAAAVVAAALVAFGVKVLGGKGGGGKSASASAAATTNTYTGPVDEYGAPASSYSVLRPGGTRTPANDNRGAVAAPAAAQGPAISFGDTNLTIQGGADRGVVEQIGTILEDHRQKTVLEARRAVAEDAAARMGRQRIGGAS